MTQKDNSARGKKFSRALLAGLIAVVMAFTWLPNLPAAQAQTSSRKCGYGESPKWDMTDDPYMPPYERRDNVQVVTWKQNQKAYIQLSYNLLKLGSNLVFTPYAEWQDQDGVQHKEKIELSSSVPPRFTPPESAVDKSRVGWPAKIKITLERIDGSCTIPAEYASRTVEVPGGKLLDRSDVLRVNYKYGEGETDASDKPVDPWPDSENTGRSVGDKFYFDKDPSQTPYTEYAVWAQGKCADVAADAAKDRCTQITVKGKEYAQITLPKKKQTYFNEILKYVDGKAKQFDYAGSLPAEGYSFIEAVDRHGNIDYPSPYSRMEPNVHGPAYGNLEPDGPNDPKPAKWGWEIEDKIGKNGDRFRMPLAQHRIPENERGFYYYVVKKDGSLEWQGSDTTKWVNVKGVAEYVNGKATVTVRAYPWLCHPDPNNPKGGTVTKNGMTDPYYTIDDSYCGFREWKLEFTDVPPAPVVRVTPMQVAESFKDEQGNWVNNFLPSIDDLKANLKVRNDNGNFVALPDNAKLEIGEGTVQNWVGYSDTEAVEKLYEKLQEKYTGNQPTREEKIKVKVTINGASTVVDVPITVVKNIYEALTQNGQPRYVPGGYLRVSLDPTNNAQDAQRTYYYVNPKAKVAIPAITPKPIPGKTHVGWELRAGQAEPQAYDLSARHQFTDSKNEIIAKYSDNVLPEKNGQKPAGTPDNFVKVTVDRGKEAKLEGQDQQSVFWVNPASDVELPVVEPIGKTEDRLTYNFVSWKSDDSREWKSGAKLAGKFTKDTVISAGYNINQLPLQPAVKTTDKIVVPEGGSVSAKDLVINQYNDGDPNNPNNLPAGMKFTFVQEPDLSSAGDKPVKVRVTYPNGDEVVIDSKITVTKDVVSQDGSNKPTVPDNFVKVTVDITDKGVVEEGAQQVKTFWVNPAKEVTIDIAEPKGKEKFKDNSGKAYNYEFTGWAPKGIKAAKWPAGDKIVYAFTKPSELVALYKLPAIDIKPVPKPGVEQISTYVGNEPNLDVIKKHIKLPDGKTFDNDVKNVEITAKPDVSKAGDSEVVVTVEYTDGVKVTVKVPVKVYDNLIPAETNGRPTRDIPDNYVKVIVIPTSLNEDSDKKVYFVNPEVEVTIPMPEINPKEGAKFVKWSIKDETYDPQTARKFVEETKIVASYEKKTNPEVSYKSGVKVIETFVGNGAEKLDYKAHIIAPDGLTIADVALLTDGFPDLSKAGDTLAKVRVKYTNGAVHDLQIPIIVRDTVIPSKDGQKPEGTPDNYVRVTFKPTQNAKDSSDKVFYVDPTVEVDIDVADPEGIEKTVDGKTSTYLFDGWDKPKKGKFTEETIVTAKFKVKTSLPATQITEIPEVTTEPFVTKLGEKPELDKYISAVVNKGDDWKIELVSEPDVSKEGFAKAQIKVTFPDGATRTTDVLIYVKKECDACKPCESKDSSVKPDGSNQSPNTAGSGQPTNPRQNSNTTSNAKGKHGAGVPTTGAQGAAMFTLAAIAVAALGLVIRRRRS
ncbi:Rib/alpha-like domain-containing protein [Propionimicrobium lymphophilum]|uniref:Rib/alpha-like domain-containing protein n=1 Tax=Propionimicrobium lymphophilum TaxID=33012 RepID=UPI00040B9EAE|nr:Rib/alpha-like domain-containing protein [Propionimicrobium lymphophilum]